MHASTFYMPNWLLFMPNVIYFIYLKTISCTKCPAPMAPPHPFYVGIFQTVITFRGVSVAHDWIFAVRFWISRHKNSRTIFIFENHPTMYCIPRKQFIWNHGLRSFIVTVRRDIESLLRKIFICHLSMWLCPNYEKFHHQFITFDLYQKEYIEQYLLCHSLIFGISHSMF